MINPTDLSYEVFISIAKASGLKIEDPHMNELFNFVREALLNLKKIEDLDLSGIEPFLPLNLLKE